MESYMYDKEFLKQLNYNREKETYIRIISLDNNDIPKEEIQGKVTGGSINVDGASVIRRTCSLSLIAEENDTLITDIYWCYNTKFKLEIGLKNNINSKYPNIIWFNMGIYIITNFSYNKSTSNITISISGKDKMCRLNGEVSGNIAMSTDFGTIEETKIVQETGEKQTTTTKLPIYEIIQNALIEYGGENSNNIIINDLNKYGYELFEYSGDKPMYMIIKQNTQSHIAEDILNITFDGDFSLSNINLQISKLNFYDFDIDNRDTASHIQYGGEECVVQLIEYSNPRFKIFPLTELDEQEPEFDIISEKTYSCSVINRKLKRIEKYYSFNTLDKNYNNDATVITYNEIPCYIAKIEYGNTAGYHRIPLVYNTDLILNVGDTVTSLLDKLKAMLGDYEYFYNLNGQFVFQKKKTYIQELFSPINGDIATPSMYASQYSYEFKDNQLFTAISNTPNINNMKNDFSVWGVKNTTNLPLHVRYGINKKPQNYKSLSIIDNNYNVDDYFDYIISGENVMIQKLKSNKVNPGTDFQIPKKIEGLNVMRIQGTTGGFQGLNVKILGIPKTIKIINNNAFLNTTINEVWYEGTKEEWNKINIGSTGNNTLLNAPRKYKAVIEGKNYSTSNYDWRELIYQMAIDYYAHNQENDFLIKLQEANLQFIEGKTGYEQYYSDMQGFWRQLYNPLETEKDIEFKTLNGYDYYVFGDDKYWNKDIHVDPTNFNFWFDFLDTKGELGKYGVDQIGSRPKAINDNAVKSIYYKETPEALFYFPSKGETLDDLEQTSYSPLQLQDSMDVLFYRSSQGNSAINKINELIYENVAITEGISITSIPIYYLEPNTRIYIEGYGDYTLDKISYSLTYNGTMNINGNKIMKQFY